MLGSKVGFLASSGPPPTAAHYTEDGSSAANFTNRIAGRNLVASGGFLTADAIAGWYYASYNSPMLTNNAKVVCTMSSTATTFDRLFIGLNCNNSDQVYAVFANSTNDWEVRTNTGAYSTLVTAPTIRVAQPGQSWVTGDTVSFETSISTGTTRVWILKKNGTEITRWTDTNSTTWGAKVDASHTEWGLGGYLQAAVARGVDSLTADDI